MSIPHSLRGDEGRGDGSWNGVSAAKPRIALPSVFPRKIDRFCGERKNKRNGVKPARRAGFTKCSLKHKGPRKINRFCGERRNKRNGVKPARRAGFTKCSLF